MEANIQSVLTQTVEIDTELCGTSHVKGVLIADQKGLCIAAKGEARAGLAATATTLAALAGQIDLEEDHPVILIEAGVRKFLIKTEEKTTVVIIKDL